MTGWWSALRIARREARRARGRSILVLAMIALPVAFMSFLAVSYDMFTLSPAEEATRHMGQADAIVGPVAERVLIYNPAAAVAFAPEARPTSSVTTEDVLALLPAGSRAVRGGEIVVSVRTRTGLVPMSGRLLDLADPMVRGKADLVQGKAPESGQVALSREAARQLGVGVGGSVSVTDPAGVYVVSGIVEYPSDLSAFVVLPPDAAALFPYGSWLVTVPGGLHREEAEALEQAGLFVYARGVAADPDLTSAEPQQLALGVIVTGLAVLEIVLLCGPAFAVGARRRARELALIAAAGARPQHLRRIVLADGVVLGVTGAAGGLVLGVGLACAARPIMEELVIHSRAGGWRFFPLALFGIAALAIGTGVLAAMVPAWTAARQDVVNVLSGRRGIVRSRRRWIVAGLALASLGVVIASAGAVTSATNVILSGVVLLELGLVCVTPALIGLVARVGRWLPLAPRLALRGAARNRTSAAPAISAIMAAVAGAVAVGVFSAGNDNKEIASYQPTLPEGYVAVQALQVPGQPQPDWTRATEIVKQVLPGARVASFQTTDPMPMPPLGDHVYGLPWAWSIVDDGTALAGFTAAEPADLAAAIRTLANGGVVVTDPTAVVNGHITLLINELRSITLPAYALTTGVPGVALVISPGALASLGLTAQTQGLIIQTTSPPTTAQIDRLRLSLADVSPAMLVDVEDGPQPANNPIQIVLGLAAVAIALGAAGIATGLAAADSRPELATLAAVGANPALRRKLAMSQAGLIAGLGAILGTVTGLGTAAALIVATNALSRSESPIPFLIPWTSIAIVVAAPLLAMAGAGLFTRSGLPIERRF